MTRTPEQQTAMSKAHRLEARARSLPHRSLAERHRLLMTATNIRTRITRELRQKEMN